MRPACPKRRSSGSTTASIRRRSGRICRRHRAGPLVTRYVARPLAWSPGLLVRPGDPAALADAIIRLLRDPDLAAAYGRAGRARVERELRVDTMVARTEALYDELLGRDRICP